MLKKNKMNGILFLVTLTVILFPNFTFAHCDSYDGPVIKDAYKAIENGKVEVVFKWIEPEHEAEIRNLFNKLASIKDGDQEIYKIVEKHFFETLVRLHREGEGAPYTGLKPAGTTKKIIVLTDQALAQNDFNGLLTKLEAHFASSLREKWEDVVAKRKTKDNSVEQGREYVEAYVAYTHFVEEIHDIIEHGGSHNH